jgi:SNF2 family DNA or RNA helicase
MLLAMMMYERMMCVYPQLISEEHLNKIRSLGLHTDINRDCGTTSHSKMDSVINHIVERKDNGNKKIIFTTFRGEIDHIQSQLTENGMSSEYIDGRITKKQRNKVLENSADVLILQIKTGNEGLNLQQYNEIYFVTPDWNPQTEAQAVARCHRIGQTRSVYVYRFVMASFRENDATRGNIEMYTETVQEKKLEMEKKVSDAQ